MVHQQVRFEWHVVEDESLWSTMAFTTETTPSKRRLWLTNIDQWLAVYLLRNLTVLFVSVVLVAGAGLTPADRLRLRATAGIQAALAGEGEKQIAGKNSFNPLVNQLVGSQAVQGVLMGMLPQENSSPTIQGAVGDDPDVKLFNVTPVGNLIMTELLISRPPINWRQTSPYWEKHFYRETTDGWQEVKPDQEFWGPTLLHETDHLRFQFSERDTATLQPVLAQMETHYLTIHQLLNLPPPLATEKLNLEITPEQITWRGIYTDRIKITSPLVSQIPEQLSATEFLAHRMVNRMLVWVVNGNFGRQTMQTPEQAPVQSFAYSWRALRWGLRSWLETELLGERWPWDQQALDAFVQQSKGRMPLRLADITSQTEGQFNDRNQRMWQSAAAESLVTYVVKTYGRERLPKLWQGLSKYNDWPTLITGVFDMPVEEFETGWNRYLAELLITGGDYHATS